MESEQEYRISRATKLLTKYGDLATPSLLDLLELMAELTDDLQNSRHPDVVSADLEKMRNVIDKVQGEAVRWQFMSYPTAYGYRKVEQPR